MEELDEHITEVITRYTGRPEMALVALQEIQGCAGYIPGAAIDRLAKVLGLPEGELLGIVSFYSELRTTPPGRHRVCICNGDSCAAAGSRPITEAVESKLGITPGQTTADGQLTYDKVYCLGNCALSPSVAIDDDVYGCCDRDVVVNRLQQLQKISHG